MRRSGRRCLRFWGEPERRFSADETAALSHEVLKEKRLVKRALYDLTVNRLVSRQGSIIEFPIHLSTARGKKFHQRDNRAGFAVSPAGFPTFLPGLAGLRQLAEGFNLKQSPLIQIGLKLHVPQFAASLHSD